MLGRLFYQLRSKYGHGLRTAWYRDKVRLRILDTQPVAADDASVAEIHVLTSEADWLNLIWALKSFYRLSGREYALCIHDDGSLSEDARNRLREHFPTARMPTRADADQAVFSELEPFPRCLAFRKTNHLSPKLYDFRHFLRSERMLLLDSDVLFFAEPTELLRRIESSDYSLNSVNSDVANAYTVTAEDANSQCGVDLIDQFNSGLGLIHKSSLKLEWIEEFLALPNVQSHFWRIEQTLFALCSSRFGVELLPPSYDVFLEGEVEERQSRHYVGKVRHLMYREGVRKLVRSGFLQDLKGRQKV